MIASLIHWTAKPIGNPLRLKLTCLQQGNAEFAVIDEGELLTLRRGGMGEKTVMIPPGSERYEVNQIIYK